MLNRRRLDSKLNKLLGTVQKLEAKSFALEPSKVNGGRMFDVTACRANVFHCCKLYEEIGDVKLKIASLAETGDEYLSILTEAMNYYCHAIETLEEIKQSPPDSVLDKYYRLLNHIEARTAADADINNSDKNMEIDEEAVMAEVVEIKVEPTTTESAEPTPLLVQAPPLWDFSQTPVMPQQTSFGFFFAPYQPVIPQQPAFFINQYPFMQ